MSISSFCNVNKDQKIYKKIKANELEKLHNCFPKLTLDGNTFEPGIYRLSITFMLKITAATDLTNFYILQIKQLHTIKNKHNLQLLLSLFSIINSIWLVYK